MSESHRALNLFPKEQGELFFLVARGRAVESYALYEQSLAMIYSALLGVSQDYAGVTFFRINNARARLSILGRLLKKRAGNTYSVFWNSLEDRLRLLDERRNQIVHWTSVVVIGSDEEGQPSRTPTLAPPNVWDRSEDTPSIGLTDFLDFILQCDFFSRLLSVFMFAVSGKLDEAYAGRPDHIGNWSRVFQEPVGFPPPDGHPLHRSV